jgi:hypothetical protein
MLPKWYACPPGQLTLRVSVRSTSRATSRSGRLGLRFRYFSCRPIGFEPTTPTVSTRPERSQSEALRDATRGEGDESAERDPACFSVSPDDSSRNVGAKRVERTNAVMTCDGALKLAIKLAVDESDYERAGALLDAARRTTKSQRRSRSPSVGESALVLSMCERHRVTQPQKPRTSSLPLTDGSCASR